MAKDAEISLDQLKKQIRNEKTEKEEDNRKVQIVVFKLDDEEYALTIDQIKEVVPTPAVAKVPQTPTYIKGVANIRGNLIAIIDLEEKFGLKNNNQIDGDRKYTLVIESENISIGVLVQEVPNTLSVKLSSIDESKNVIQLSSLDENSMKGIVKYQDRMIILIDLIGMMKSNDIEKVTNL